MVTWKFCAIPFAGAACCGNQVASRFRVGMGEIGDISLK